jgi:hypothetical protein
MSYAMTGGQIAPTSFHDEKTITSPYGNPESPFNITKLVRAAGASYVAKWSTYHVVELQNSIKEAINHKGFSFIEVLSQCPTQQRRIFNLKGSVDSLSPRILEMFKESTFVMGRKDGEDYFYAIPSGSAERTLGDIESVLDIDAEIIEHMEFGRIIKIHERMHKKSVEKVETVDRVLESLKGKIQLGVFKRRIRPEFIDSLKLIVKKAQEESY